MAFGTLFLLSPQLHCEIIPVAYFVKCYLEQIDISIHQAYNQNTRFGGSLWLVSMSSGKKS